MIEANPVAEVVSETIAMRAKMKNYTKHKDVSFDVRIGMKCEESTLKIPAESPFSDLSYQTT